MVHNLLRSQRVVWGHYCLMVMGLVLLVGINTATAQHNIDSQLAQTDRLKLLHPDSAYIILKELTKQAVAEKLPVEEALALQQTGYIFYHHGSLTQALDNYLKADKLFSAAN